MSEQAESFIDRMEREGGEILIKNPPRAPGAAAIPPAAPPAAAAAPPPATPPATPPAELEIEDVELKLEGKVVEMPTEIRSKEAQRGWRQWKKTVSTTLAGYDGKLKELQDKLVKAPPSQDTAKLEAKIAELTKAHSDAMEQLGQVSLERTPQFQQHYVQKEAALVEEAKGIVGTEHADRVAAIMAMPEGKYRREALDELYAELTASAQSELGATLRNQRVLAKEKEAEIKNWRSNLAEKARIEGEQQAHMTQRQKQQLGSVFERVMAEVTKDNPALMKREKDDVWNKDVDNHIAAARELFEGAGQPDERARASLWASSAPMLQKLLKEQAAEIENLKSELTKVRGSSTTLTTTEPKAPPAAPVTGSLVDRIVETAANQGWAKSSR